MYKIIKVENKQEHVIWTDDKLDNAMYEAIGYCPDNPTVNNDIKIIDDNNRIMWQATA